VHNNKTSIDNHDQRRSQEARGWISYARFYYRIVLGYYRKVELKLLFLSYRELCILVDILCGKTVDLKKLGNLSASAVAVLNANL